MIYQEEYARYSRILYAACLRILANAEEAEEAMHDVLLHYFSFSGRFDSEEQKKSWLFKVAASKSIDRLRKKHTVLFEDLGEEAEEHEGQGLCEDLDTAARVRRIKEAMRLLAPGYRAVLSLFLFEGYDFDEIAGLLSIRAATVRSQYVRGRAKLRALLLEKDKWIRND
ncbi:MAG: sigma-70 family RNA polymerase sigma factor [Bacteroidales bacterium]|nr:sigma-70 family RNA polymerase sigma factor [Bacteroidales bacterium]MCL2738999.1 sigma-70 family RNA polymerase sigma factor [Bacteroidales bacterium]